MEPEKNTLQHLLSMGRCWREQVLIMPDQPLDDQQHPPAPRCYSEEEHRDGESREIIIPITVVAPTSPTTKNFKDPTRHGQGHDLWFLNLPGIASADGGQGNP